MAIQHLTGMIYQSTTRSNDFNANYGAGYNGENSAKMRFATQVLIWEVPGWNVQKCI